MAPQETLIINEVPAPASSSAGAQGVATSSPSAESAAAGESASGGSVAGMGLDFLPGLSLRDAIQILGGYEGSMTNPLTNVTHSVSITAFEGRDLDNTYIRIAFGFVDPRKVGTQRPAP